MKKQPLKFLLIGLLLLVGIWIAWPKDEAKSNPGEPDKEQSNRKPIGSNLTGSGDGTKSNSNPNNQIKSSDQSGTERISRLLTHPTLSNKEVAEQLLAIAKDKRMSEQLREEAMSHGLNLDLPVFAELAADTHLPLAMASNLLHSIVNANENPSMQLQAYKEMLYHESPEIRDQAKELLAFVLEDDSGQADIATLVRMADAKIKALAEEKSQDQ